MTVEFTNDLLTGNTMIDSQHKELFSRINDLLISCENSGAMREVIKILLYLADYTDFHFKAEEELQRHLEYPGLEEHVKKHLEFRKTVEALHTHLENEGVDDAFRDRVKKEVLDWLIYHINGFDRSVAEYKFMRDNPSLL